jgi:hypothetical protein
MAKFEYEKQDIDGSESEGHKKLNADIRAAFARNRRLLRMPEPKKLEPKRDGQGRTS